MSQKFYACAVCGRVSIHPEGECEWTSPGWGPSCNKFAVMTSVDKVTWDGEPGLSRVRRLIDWKGRTQWDETI